MDILLSFLCMNMPQEALRLELLKHNGDTGPALAMRVGGYNSLCVHDMSFYCVCV